MNRKIVSITGSRADYGLMESVHRAIASNAAFSLDLIVTGMHLLPEFATSLETVRADKIGRLHEIDMALDEDTGGAMARSVGKGVLGMAGVFSELRPDIALLLGDRSEMLAGAIVAAHMNVAIVHLCGGDFSGSIDDSVRNAISKFAHFHLTSCEASTRRLIAMGESPERILEVGNPGLDLLRGMDFVPFETIAAELKLPRDRPFLLATLHPVTDDTSHAAAQMKVTLEALAEIDMPVVFTYPNSDSGGRAMLNELESWRDKPFLHIVPNLGSRRYLSLMRSAAALVGNSSSGILEAPSFRIPVVNIGTRQHGRLQAGNILNVPFERNAISRAVRFALDDPGFRKSLAACENLYGDGRTAERVTDILSRLKLTPSLIAKWLPASDFLEAH